ncbi:MAG: carboxymuconolactone decarboxylase family protein, partial [Chthoniobacterales bacterium]|nr:carboxymuconolactone decarboxylase family protein [Chthoniobacterales bacterium]
MQPEMLTKEQKKEYNRFPSNVMLGLLVTTCCTPGFFSLGASFPAGKLSDKDRQLVIMRVASLSRCAYERMQHYPMAIKAGWDDGEIKLIESGNLGVEREDTILRFVDECVKQVKV